MILKLSIYKYRFWASMLPYITFFRNIYLCRLLSKSCFYVNGITIPPQPWSVNTALPSSLNTLQKKKNPFLAKTNMLLYDFPHVTLNIRFSQFKVGKTYQFADWGRIFSTNSSSCVYYEMCPISWKDHFLGKEQNPPIALIKLK